MVLHFHQMSYWCSEQLASYELVLSATVLYQKDPERMRHPESIPEQPASHGKGRQYQFLSTASPQRGYQIRDQFFCIGCAKGQYCELKDSFTVLRLGTAGVKKGGIISSSHKSSMTQVNHHRRACIVFLGKVWLGSMIATSRK